MRPRWFFPDRSRASARRPGRYLVSVFFSVLLFVSVEPAPPVPEASLLAPFFFLVFFVVVVVSLDPLLVSVDFIELSVLLPPVPLVDLELELPDAEVSLPLPVELLPEEVLRSFFAGSVLVCARPGLASINPRINPNFANIFTAFPPIAVQAPVCPCLAAWQSLVARQ